MERGERAGLVSARDPRGVFEERTALKMNVPFVKIEKDDLAYRDYAGYDIVARALAAKMGEHLKEKTSGSK